MGTRFRTSLLLKSLASAGALLTLFSVCGLGVFLYIEDRKLERELELRGRSMAQFLARELPYSLLVGDKSETRRMLEAAAANEDILFLEVVNPAGQQICAVWHEGGMAKDGNGHIELREAVMAPARDRLIEWESPRESRPALGTLRMGISLRKRWLFFRQTLYSSVALTLCFLALTCGAVFVALRRLLRPLNTLVQFTRRVGDGDLGLRAPVERADEVGQLAAAFNDMVERLGKTTVSRNYMDNILSSMGDSLIVTDREGRIERVNPRTEELLGYSGLELAGRRAASLLVEEESSLSAAGIERTYRTREGNPIPILLSCSGLRNAGGSIVGYVWMAQDVSVLKRTQFELERARDAAEQANRAKSAFLANMSHELRTPLNAVIGYSQMLRENYIPVDQPQVCADLGKIERSGQMLLDIINDILDISKIEAGRETVRPQMVDVGAILEDVTTTLAPLALKQSNVLEVDCPADARLAYADLGKFRQSVLNLVNNALKFTERGRVSVRVDKLSDSSGDWTEVHVTDTGIGIGAANLGKLFQPFSQVDGSATRKYNGTGLGLAISRRFCQMMGGDITVESQVGRGSRFSIRVPATRQFKSEITNEEPAGAPHMAGHRGGNR